MRTLRHCSSISIQLIRRIERFAHLVEDRAPDEIFRIHFGIAKTCALRFLETRQREDMNLAEADLNAFASGGPHAAAASILLGLALSEPTDRRDPKRALELLEQGFRIEAVPAEIEDPARAQKRLEELRAELKR